MESAALRPVLADRPLRCEHRNVAGTVHGHLARLMPYHFILLPNQAFFNRRENIVEPLFCTIHFRFVKLNLSL